MKSWLKFGLLNAIVGLIIGAWLTFTAIGDGYESFIIAAPLSVFLVGSVFWKILVKDDMSSGKLVIVGLLTGTVSHYFTFIILSIMMNICFWLTGGCTSSLREWPASVTMMFGAAFIFSFFSLLAFGWITAPLSVAIGFIVKKQSSKQ